ncbi:DEAD/DEAH box helicase [Methanopyrus sp. KOL6]|uniref:DEAD/DEAH box helicase n=1 Tax=Methanopyrus sp. KOL6 TaxID=1937004 RepID=UPI000B4B0B3E|nr:DEAD/DEAH box helicase [Methanopyrus sp. KOL6]
MPEWRRVNWDVLEYREYQVSVAAEILDSRDNTLVVIPTGLGKTAIGVMVLSELVDEGRAVFLAPTVPLVNQHARFIERVTRGLDVKALTGKVRPERRKVEWKKSDVIVATPHVIRNDIIEGRINPDEASIVVFDEAHRAVGGYPYVYVSKEFNCLKVGLTASPGSDVKRIKEVVQNLGIERIIVKTEKDPDVKKYLGRVKVEWVDVELPEWFDNARRELQRAFERRLELLEDMGFLRSSRNAWVGKLLSLREEIREQMAKRRERASWCSRALGVVAEALRIARAREILETQGIGPFLRYVERLTERKRSSGGPSLRRILGDPNFQRAVRECKSASLRDEPDHPKLPEVEELVEDVESALVFTQYVDTAKLIADYLKESGMSIVVLLGKEHMKEREQLDAIESIRRRECRVLVSTSVGEEGLDLPTCEEVVLYEPVPSEIRTIQRIGRTARDGAVGNAHVLVARGSFPTLDEIYFHVARRREKKMLEAVMRVREWLRRRKRKMAAASKNPEKLRSRARTLDQFVDGGRSKHERDEVRPPSRAPVIVVDSREINTKVVEHLRRKPVTLERDTLELADYIVGEGVGVERKSESDFARSLLDGRLMDQAQEMAREFDRAVIIVEGNPRKEIEPESVDGALATLAVDFGISVLQSSGPEETAELLYRMARRFEERQRPRPRKRRSTEDLRVEMLSCVPGVGPELARRLLDEFGSIGDVVNASLSELKRVKGIGERKAREIRRFFWG